MKFTYYLIHVLIWYSIWNSRISLFNIPYEIHGFPYLVCKNIRIFQECEVGIEKSVRGSLFGITWQTSWCQTVILRDWFFYPHQTTMIDSFSCIPFDLPMFDFNVGVAINESCSLTLTSAILKVDVVCDLLYNQCIKNMCCYSFFIYPMGRIRVCKIRFVSTGETRGKPYLVCKKKHFPKFWSSNGSHIKKTLLGASFFTTVHIYIWVKII